MANTSDKVIHIALAEVGYLEKKSNKNLDAKTKNAGSDNYTKYGRDMHAVYPAVMDFPAYWCDCFVDWCFYKAYGTATAKSLLDGNFDDYTIASATMYKKKGAWYTSGPKVGDQIFFKNADGTICHTGLIYKIANGYLYTVEGNTSSLPGVVANGGCVATKSYSLSYPRIAGYGRPKYDYTSSSTTKKSANKPTVAHPLLKLKMKSVEVVNLQKDLNYLLSCKLATDGKFGDATFKQVKYFQHKYHLKEDGVYGDDSFTKMRSLIK